MVECLSLDCRAYGMLQPKVEAYHRSRRLTWSINPPSLIWAGPLSYELSPILRLQQHEKVTCSISKKCSRLNQRRFFSFFFFSSQNRIAETRTLKFKLQSSPWNRCTMTAQCQICGQDNYGKLHHGTDFWSVAISSQFARSDVVRLQMNYWMMGRCIDLRLGVDLKLFWKSKMTMGNANSVEGEKQMKPDTYFSG